MSIRSMGFRLTSNLEFKVYPALRSGGLPWISDLDCSLALKVLSSDYSPGLGLQY